MIGDGNKTGFHSFEDLPETEQERELKIYHAKIREQQAEKAISKSPTLADSNKVVPAWMQNQRQQSMPKSALTKLMVAEIYKDAIEKNLERFKDRYNVQHPNNKISLALTLNKRIFDETNGHGAVAQAMVGVEIRENGIGRMLINKVYNFTHKRQIMDEGEWKLTLYSEILYEMVGGTITLAILTNPENNIKYGNEEQGSPGEQTGDSGNSRS